MYNIISYRLYILQYIIQYIGIVIVGMVLYYFYCSLSYTHTHTCLSLLREIPDCMIISRPLSAPFVLYMRWSQSRRYQTRLDKSIEHVLWLICFCACGKRKPLGIHTYNIIYHIVYAYGYKIGVPLNYATMRVGRGRSFVRAAHSYTLLFCFCFITNRYNYTM